MRVYLNIFEASFPIVYFNKYNDNAWITKGIRISCKKKKILYLLNRNCNNPKLKSYYTHYCLILRKTIREAKRQYYNELILNSENKVKATWKIIKKLTKKQQHSRQMFPPLKVDDKEQPPNKVAQIIKNYYLNIPGNLKIQATKNNDFISLLETHYPYVFPPIQIVPVTEGEKSGIINTMKPKNSWVYDGISTKILKLCGSQISKPLTFIIDKSLKTGVFPERLKCAVVTPLHKRGDVSDIVNYRPISLLPVFLKILEKIMHSRLYQHLQTNNILTTEQYGFRKCLSTEQATYSLTNNILMAWNKKIHIGGIFCDFTKAFDCVNHDILIA